MPKQRLDRTKALKFSQLYPSGTRVRVQFQRDWVGQGEICGDADVLGDGTVVVNVAQVTALGMMPPDMLDATKVLGPWVEDC